MIKIKNIKPLFTALVTTMDKYDEDKLVGNLIDVTKREGCVKEYQKVLSIGDSVRGIKVGDMVSVNPTRYSVKKHQEGSLKDGIITDNPVITYNFDIIELDGKQCLLLQDRDINFVITDFEEVPDEPTSSFIQPEKKTFIA